MALSARKEEIIKAIVSDYIDSAEPVSSKDVQERHLPALSSATIRNEMAALEEMGYLTQLHTSSGRIPSATAYRLYVDKLMPRKKLTRSELNIIRQHFAAQATELRDILTATARVISEITHLTSVAYAEDDVSGATINAVKFVKLSPYEMMVIVVTDRGVLKDAQVKTASDINESYYLSAGEFVTDFFKGMTVRDAAAGRGIDAAVERFEQFYKSVLSVLKKYSDAKTAEIVLEGGSKLLDQPEYKTLGKAKAMLEIIETREQLMPLLNSPGGVSFNIKINSDNELKEGAPECAVITANYQINGKSVGNAGVIGPIRMDYPKVLSVLDYVGKIISGGGSDKLEMKNEE